MTLRHLATASLCVLLALSPTNRAEAQQRVPCGDRTAILKHLAAAYSEAPTAVGLDARGRVLEVLSSPGGETWTILVTAPSGLTCMIASGIAWEKLPEPPGPAA